MQRACRGENYRAFGGPSYKGEDFASGCGARSGRIADFLIKFIFRGSYVNVRQCMKDGKQLGGYGRAAEAKGRPSDPAWIEGFGVHGSFWWVRYVPAACPFFGAPCAERSWLSTYGTLFGAVVYT